MFKDTDIIYELIGVLVHNGTATSGHYYAYIKDVEDGQWFKYNDAQVTLADQIDVVKAFGQKSKVNKSRRNLAYESGENAYMLIY